MVPPFNDIRARRALNLAVDRAALTVARNLNELGYHAFLLTVKRYFDYIGDSRNRAQLGLEGWGADYPASAGFIVPTFSCSSLRPGNGSNNNVAQFCDPGIDRQITDALSLQFTDPPAAHTAWERIHQAMTRDTPWVPIANEGGTNVVSHRVGHFEENPLIGALFGQMWVQ